MKTGEPFSPYKKLFHLQVPLSIAAQADLSDAAKLVFGLLAFHAGKDAITFVSVKALARELKCSEDKVSRALKELMGLGLIGRQQAGNGRPATTTLLWSEILRPSLRTTATADLQELPTPTPGIDGEQTEVTPATAVLRIQQPQDCGSAAADLQEPIKEEEIQEDIQEESDTSDLQSGYPKTCESFTTTPQNASSEAKTAAEKIDLPNYQQCAPEERPQPPRQRWAKSEIRQITIAIIEYLDGAFDPPDRIMAMKILDHGWGAGVMEICWFIDSLKPRYPPGSPNGPRNVWWFVTVVSVHFIRRHQQEAARVSDPRPRYAGKSSLRRDDRDELPF